MDHSNVSAGLGLSMRWAIAVAESACDCNSRWQASCWGRRLRWASPALRIDWSTIFVASRVPRRPMPPDAAQIRPMHVEEVYALPDRAWSVVLELPSGAIASE